MDDNNPFIVTMYPAEYFEELERREREERELLEERKGGVEKKKRIPFTSDAEIMSKIRYEYGPGLGRNGFRFEYKVPNSFPFYDEGIILWDITGSFNTFGLFKNEVIIHATVYSIDTRYALLFQKKTKESCSPAEFPEKFLDRFLCVLRLFALDQLSFSEIREEMGGTSSAGGLQAFKDSCNQFENLFE